jgi:hypothetical protein
LSYNGTTQYVDTEQTFESVFKNSFSINVWVRTNSTEDNADIMKVRDNSNNSSVSIFIDEEYIEANYESNNQQNGVLSHAFQPGPAADFTMVTVTFENKVDLGPIYSVIMTLYINGNNVDSSQGTVNMDNYVSINNFIIGNGSNGFFNGDIDNVCIFDKILNQEEIDFLYNEGAGTEELENNIPNSPLFIYDYKNSITEIIQDDWYNFNIKVLDDTHGYTSASDFTEDYYLVMSVSGSNTSNFIIWELIDNDEQINPSLELGSYTSSAIKF